MSSRRTLVVGLALLVICGAGAWLILGGGAGRGADSPRKPEGPGDAEPALPGSPPGEIGDAETGAGEGDADAPEGGGSADPEEEEFSFDEETAYSVTVRVLDREGKPVAGKVRILDPRVEWTLGELPEREKGLHTGYLPEAGQWAAEADHEGTRMRASFPITDEEPAAEVTIRYPGTGVVSGAVLSTLGSLDRDVKGKHRVLGQEDLSVELVRTGGEASALLSCLVDEKGAYRIAAVPAGAYLVRVKKKFHVSRVEVAENEHVVHDVVLGGGRISGRVTDQKSGVPLEDVQVVIQLSLAEGAGSAELRGAGFASISDRLVPDEDGNYVFANLPAGTYRMFSNGRRHAPLKKVATIDRTQSDVRVDFPLEMGSLVDIAVLDLEGEPVESPLWITQGIRCGFTGVVSGLRTGKHDFITWARGHEVQIRRGVEFLPGEPTRLEFRLAKETPTKLVFRNAAGHPVEGVRVSIMVDGMDLQPLFTSFLREKGVPLRITGPDGHVMVRGVRAGPVRVVAKRSGFAAIDAKVELSAEKAEALVSLETADTRFTFRVRITKVSPGGQADRLGLEAGDVILSYDGTKIDSTAALTAAIRKAGEGGTGTVKMVVESKGFMSELTVETGLLGVSLEEFEE